MLELFTHPQHKVCPAQQNRRQFRPHRSPVSWYEACGRTGCWAPPPVRFCNITHGVTAEKLTNQHREDNQSTQRNWPINVEKLTINTEKLTDQCRETNQSTQRNCPINTEKLANQHRKTDQLTQRNWPINTEKPTNQHRETDQSTQRNLPINVHNNQLQPFWKTHKSTKSKELSR